MTSYEVKIVLVGVIHRRKGENPPTNEIISSKELFGKSIYCPICRRELRGWGEGCTVIHLYCDHCGIVMTLANNGILEGKDLEELEVGLLSEFDKVSSRW